ncbi:hypothetical protein [uncultured Clostridium sp.]|uniref:hypothetical protein n=1 Tax=uncultured Clostridium sp. TaxID=59620 RepID=UPI0026300EAD|nr:hypothetical protein [uncultured Clostridium sp.]
MILLGKGTFYINDVPIGLTRGGGQFVVERETRPIAADGDKGIVKGRVVMDSSVPKLTMNSLEVINENIDKMYCAIKKIVDEANTKTKVTGTSKITEKDFNATCSWIGKTKNGKEVIITIHDAINLENLDWGLADKDEVVGTLTYTACYDDAMTEAEKEEYEPWEVEWIN